MDKTNSLAEMPMEEKIKALVEKISKKLENFTLPMSEPSMPQSEEELDAYIASLEVQRDLMKDYQELHKDFIELNTLLAKELPNLDPIKGKIFSHQARSLSDIFQYKLGEAQVTPAIKGIEQEIEESKGLQEKIRRRKKESGLKI